MTDSDRSDYVLKVPEDNTVGITPELRRFIEDNGRLELYGSLLEPGYGTTEGGAVPIGVLEDLIQDRMEKAEVWRDKGLNADYHATKEFADELQDLITEYGDPDE